MFITPAELAEHRADALDRMESRAAVMRTTGLPVQDEATGLEVPEWATVHVGLPFRLGGETSGASGTRTIDVGGVELQLASRVGHFPHDTDDLADGDLIEITAGENAGTVWRIVEADWQDQATARRVPIVATSRPEEWAP